MIIFQKPGLKINWDWNIRLNGYKLTRSDQIKYLGIYLDKYLDGHYQTKLVIQKLAISLVCYQMLVITFQTLILRTFIVQYLSHISDMIVRFGTSMAVS